MGTGLVTYPWSALCALAYVYAVVALYIASQSHKSIRKLYSGDICVITVAVATVMTVFIGFAHTMPGIIYYVVTLGLTTVMGLAMMDDIWHIGHRRAATILAHLGVFIIFTAGIFGHADKQSARMTIDVGGRSAIAVKDDGEIITLPFMLELDRFVLEEYAPKIFISDTLGALYDKAFLEAERDGASARVGEWSLEAKKYLELAAKIPGEEEFKPMMHVGAAPAVYVQANDGKKKVEGWVSCGSFLFDGASLDLGDGLVVHMPKPEPQRFASELIVTAQKGNVSRKVVSVGHPLHIDGWMLYQSGYDAERGRWSTESSLLCVRDPWYPIIAVGLWIILAAGVMMILTAGGRKKEDKG